MRWAPATTAQPKKASSEEAIAPARGSRGDSARRTSVGQEKSRISRRGASLYIDPVRPCLSQMPRTAPHTPPDVQVWKKAHPVASPWTTTGNNTNCGRLRPPVGRTSRPTERSDYRLPGSMNGFRAAVTKPTSTTSTQSLATDKKKPRRASVHFARRGRVCVSFRSGDP